MTYRATIAASSLLLLGACAAPPPAAPAPDPAPPVPAASASVGEPQAPVAMARAWLSAPLNLRAGPGTDQPIVEELPAGAEIWIGRPNRAGWAQVYNPEEFTVSSVATRGWIFTRTPRLRSKPPARPRKG
jgi:hypothetical protein